MIRRSITRLIWQHKYVRFSSNGRGEFISLLPNRNVVGPFADPQKIVATSLPVDLRKVVEVPDTVTNVSDAKNMLEEVGHAEEKIMQEPVSTASPVTQEFEKEPVMPSKDKPDDLAGKPSSAMDEFDALKASLEKMEKASSTSGDGSSNSTEGFDQHAESEKRRKKMERNTKIGGIILLGGSIAGAIAFGLYYGRAKRDDAGNVIPDKHTGSILAPFYRIYDSIWQWRDFVVEPSRAILLPDPLPAPYLQPKYTVVIEMKNVLVNPQWTYKTGYRFAKRPALDYFLDVVGYPNFEVVIYTNESAMTAMPVLDSVDPNQRIMFRLFRDCTKYSKGKHMKDLSKLNRDLSKVIYIDFDPMAGSLNPENMLRVPEWKGNADDTSLVDLAELLKTIHLSDVEDVRPTIQYYSQFDDPAKEFRRRAVYLADQETQRQQAEGSQDQSLLKRYSGKLFGFRRHQST